MEATAAAKSMPYASTTRAKPVAATEVTAEIATLGELPDFMARSIIAECTWLSWAMIGTSRHCLPGPGVACNIAFGRVGTGDIVVGRPCGRPVGAVICNVPANPFLQAALYVTANVRTADS